MSLIVTDVIDKDASSINLRRYDMAAILDTALAWGKKLSEVGITLLALAVILQVLFGPNVAFLPGDVVGNIIGLVGSLGSNGVVGLVAAGVLYWLFTKK